MKVDIAIPVLNEERFIRNCMESVMAFVIEGISYDV